MATTTTKIKFTPTSWFHAKLVFDFNKNIVIVSMFDPDDGNTVEFMVPSVDNVRIDHNPLYLMVGGRGVPMMQFPLRSIEMVFSQHEGYERQN